MGHIRDNNQLKTVWSVWEDRPSMWPVRGCWEPFGLPVDHSQRVYTEIRPDVTILACAHSARFQHCWREGYQGKLA